MYPKTTLKEFIPNKKCYCFSFRDQVSIAKEYKQTNQ